MDDVKIYYSIEIRMRVQFYVLQGVTDETGLYLADKNNSPEEDQTASAAIPKIVPDEITMFLMNLYEHPAIEERN